MAEPALDLTGLTPLDTAGLQPLGAPAPSLDLSGLTPLDTSGLTPLGDEQPGLGSRVLRSIPVVGPLVSVASTDYATEFGKGAIEGGKNLAASGLKGYGALRPELARQQVAALDQIDAGPPADDPNERWAYRLRRGVQHPSADVIAERRARAQEIADTPVTEQPLYRAGQAIEDFGKDTLAAKPGWENSWTRDIGSGFGSMATGMGMSLIPLVGPGLAGVTFLGSGAGEAADRAVKENATEQEIRDAAALGTAAGATDVVDALLPHLGGTGKALGFLRRVGSRAVYGALAEGGQEGVQQLIQNAIAQNIYKPDQDLTEDIPRSVIIGMIVGGTTAAGFSAAEGRGRAQPQPVADASTGTLDASNTPADAYSGAPADIPEGALPADALLPAEQPPDDLSGLRPVAPPGADRPTLRAMLDDPRSADEIRAEIEAQQRADALARIGEDAGNGFVYGPDDYRVRVSSPGSTSGVLLEKRSDSNQASGFYVGRDGKLVDLDKINLSDPQSREQIWLPPTPEQRSAAEEVLREAAVMNLRDPKRKDVLGRLRDIVLAGTREAPVKVETPDDVHLGAEQTATPTPAQAEAGNYQKRHLKWHRLNISIETEKGQERTGVGPDGKRWSVPMPAPYGYILETEGKDGDHLDITLGNAPQAPNVYVVDQIDPQTHKFDEHKSFGAFNSEAEARAAYEASFSDGSGPSRIGAVTTMPVDDYLRWVDEGNHKKPLAYKYAPVKHISAAPPQATGPLSLVQFLASRGGLRPDPGGELKSLGLHGKGGRLVVPGLGYRNVVRPNGMTLDEAREAAVEAGYLHDPGWNTTAQATSTPNDLLRAIADELGGRRTFARGEELAGADAESKRQREIADEQLEHAHADVAALVKEHGLLASDEQMREAAEATLTRAADPLDAIVEILERDALADIAEAEQHQPQEQAHGQDDATGTDGRGASRAATVQQQAHPGGAQDEAPAARVEPDQDQRASGATNKAVDANGDPLTVYHGTHGTFDRFDRTAGTSAKQGMDTIDVVGSWFSTSQKDARGFGPNVIAAELTITNPLVVNGWAGLDAVAKANGLERTEQKTRDFFQISGKKLRAWLEQQGYDGIHMIGGEDAKVGEFDYWVALDPGQIKTVSSTRSGSIPPARPAAQELPNLGRSPSEEATPAGPQAVLPGAEKVSPADMAARGAKAPLRPKVAQKPVDVGLFSDESKQGDLVDQSRKLPQAPTVQGLFLQVGGKRYEVSSYEEASKKVTAAGDATVRGGQTPTEAGFTSPLLVDGAGKVIGYVAWNGNVFPGEPGSWKPGTEMLYRAPGWAPPDGSKPIREQGGPGKTGASAVSGPTRQEVRQQKRPFTQAELDDYVAKNFPPGWTGRVTDDGKRVFLKSPTDKSRRPNSNGISNERGEVEATARGIRRIDEEEGRAPAGARSQQPTPTALDLPTGLRIRTSDEAPVKKNGDRAIRVDAVDADGTVHYTALLRPTHQGEDHSIQWVENKTRKFSGLGVAFYNELAKLMEQRGGRLLARFDGPESLTTSAGKVHDQLRALGMLKPTGGLGPYVIEPAGAETSGPTIDLARKLLGRLKTRKPLTWRQLQQIATEAHGGTLAAGTFDRKDMYDALELAVNMWVKEDVDLRIVNGGWQRAVQQLEQILANLPTQTVRSEEQESFQQFSTPPHYALAVAYVANLRDGDVALEPSAGTGSIVAAATHPGVTIVANELSERRADMLRALVGEDGRVFTENAEQLNNILPKDVKPTVVVMNPPFSQTAGRMGDKRDINVGANHIEQALKRLEPGGRLVAIVGRGMTMGAPRFREWWAKVSKEHSVRANIGVDGSVYGKYGTNFGTRLLVIDKVPPTGAKPVLTEAQTVDDLMRALEPIRDGRPAAEQQQRESGSTPVAERGEGARAGARPAPADAGVLGPAAQRGGGRLAGSGRAGVARPDQFDGGVAGEKRPDVAVQQPERPGGGPSRGVGASAATGVEPEGGRGDRAQPDLQPAAKPSAGAPASGERVELEHAKPGTQAASEIDESLYQPYEPHRVRVKGAAKHPGPLVESAAMSSVEAPEPNYKPTLPRAVIENGKLSLPQLEAVIYAGQAHQQMLPAAEGETPRRKAIFIGDGTGVGKGREIAGIILDNWGQGRTKAVWVSEKRKLLNDAKRDWSGLGQDANLIFNVGKTKTGEAIKGEKGIGFITYDTLKGGMSDQAALARGGFARGQQVKLTNSNRTGAIVSAKPGGPKDSPTYRVKLDSGDEVEIERAFITAKDEAPTVKTRIDQLVDWLGADFDGVIALDEAHNMANAVATKEAGREKDAAQKALAGLLLQERLPNARIVYVSATGATEVGNLAYAERLGLWGRGTPFASRAKFIADVEQGGIAAMELIARDMKQLGLYLARNLSYDGVEYDRVEHKLTPAQRENYDTLAEAWQVVLRNFNDALESTGGKKDWRARAAAASAFWGAHQRFFNQVVTSMQMPSVIKAVEADLKAGRQAVLQLTNTNEAAQERAAAKAETAEDIEDLDITPRDQIIQLVEKSFPTQAYEEYLDGEKVRVRPVVDKDGKPVQDAEAVAMRDALIERLASLKVPQGPLDMILDHFGVDTVAEVTGRGRRFVLKPDERTGEMRRVEESRPGSSNQAETDGFQAGKKKVLVFSEAGGTGASYHADNAAASKGARRAHYLVQAGWRADKAVQGFGRTHRTNQASAPIFHLVTTDLDGQKRFISSIARRLGQLGALTKGQRQAGDQGVFSARDNLESREATLALAQFFSDLHFGRLEGITIDEFEAQTGLQLRTRDDEGRITGIKDPPPITQFLNRLLSLKIDFQNRVFAAFSEKLDGVIESRQQAGLLDVGLETVRADKIEKQSERTVHTAADSGAVTKYVKLTLADRFEPIAFNEVADAAWRNIKFWAKSPQGRVYGVEEAANRTNKDGEVIEQYRLISPVASSRLIERSNVNGRDSKWSRIERGEASKLWSTETASAPEFIERDLHLITGAILPIWDRLKGSPRVVRLQTDQGERFIGRVVPESGLADTLTRLGAEADAKKISPEQLFTHLMAGGRAKLANGWTLKRARVADEQRIELDGPESYSESQQVKQDGVFSERIGYQYRLFVPTDPAAGARVLAKLTEHRPVVETTGARGEELASMLDAPRMRRFGIPAAASEPIATFRNDQPLKRHPDYRAAKAGDGDAAERLVEALVRPEQIDAARARFGVDVTYVPVNAEEQSGANAIPDALAAFYAERAGGESTSEIIQANQAFHTGAGAMERIANRAVFEGEVKPGARYVLVDDVSVMGSTLADLADHIQRNGGEVVGAVVLVSAGRSGVLVPTKATIRDIERRFGNAVQDLFGIDPAGLTADEAAYLRNFKDVDALRARGAAAEVERAARLRSKGIPPEGVKPGKSEDDSGPGGAASDSGALFKRRGLGEQSPDLRGPGYLTPAAQQRRADLERMLTAIVRQLTGRNTTIKFEPGTYLPGARASGGYGTRQTQAEDVTGRYLTADRVIEIALASADPAGTAFHESWHDIEFHLLTEREIALLKRETERMRPIAADFLGQKIDELDGFEVRAYAFQAYVEARMQGKEFGGHTGVARLFGRLLNFLRKVRNALSGMGFRTTEDIFETGRKGGYRNRPDQGTRTMAELAQAVQPGASKTYIVAKAGNERGHVVFGAHRSRASAEAQQDDLLRSEWDRFQREQLDVEDREPYPGSAEAYRAANVNARGDFVNDGSYPEIYEVEGVAGDEVHVVSALNENGDGTDIYGVFASAAEAAKRQDEVARAMWAEKGREDYESEEFKALPEGVPLTVEQTRSIPIEPYPGLRNALRYLNEDAQVGPRVTRVKAQGEQLLSVLTPNSTAPQRQQAMQGFIARGQPLDRALRVPFDIFGGLDEKGVWKPGLKLWTKDSTALTGALLGARLGAAITNPLGAAAGHAAGRLIGGKSGAGIGEAVGALTGGLPGAAAGAAVGAVAGKLFMAKFSPDGRFAFLNPILEMTRSGLIDRYNLRNLPGYVERERGRALDERAKLLRADDILKAMNHAGVGLDEARILHAMITEREVGPEQLSRLAEPIQAAIEDWGQEAVRYGLISPESFERYRGTYMNRSYRKHELDENGLVRMVSKMMGSYRKRIIGNQLKGRGIFEEIALSRLMKDDPEWHGAARGKPENGAKFFRLDEMAPQQQMEFDGDPPPEKVLRIVWWPADRAIPNRYSSFKRQGTWEVRGERGGKLVLWRDLTKAERTNLGEILDARYTFAKTALQAAHDLATGKFYWDIAQNEEWAKSGRPEGRVIDAAEWQRGGHAYKQQTYDWVRVPDVDIPGTGGKKRYGALAGKWVREEIWRDLHEIDVATNLNSLAGFWRAIMTQWKLNKTARTPTVHVNNVMSNFFLMDLMDVRMQDLVAGVNSYRNGDAHYQEAFEHGAFGADMISKEIRENTLKPILDDIARQMTAQPPGRHGALGQISRFTEMLWTGMKKADGWARWAYQAEDEVFRMAAYMRRRQLGDDPKQAAQVAREQFIDYDVRAPWVRAARNTVLPFITYTYRAVPLVANAVATRPWKIAKYAMLAYGANALAYALLGDGGDEDKERRALRENEQGRTWLGSYRMTRMPFNDTHGNPMFVDVRNWVPAGNVLDFGDGDIPQWMFLGGPLVIGAELATNRSTFTGQELFNTRKHDWWDRQSLRAAHAFKSAAPNAPWIPGSYAWDRIAIAARGGTGRDGTPYSVPVAAVSSMGIKLKPLDIQDAMARKGEEFGRVERALNEEMSRLSSQHSRKLISDSAYENEKAEVLKKLKRNADKATETFKSKD